MSRELLLHDYLNEVSGYAVEAGEFDCALFAAGWVDKLRGSDLVTEWASQYSTFQEGARLLKRKRIRTLRDLASKYIEPVGGWMFALPGDVALVMDNKLVFGIVGSGGVVHCLHVTRGLDVCALHHAHEVYRP